MLRRPTPKNSPKTDLSITFDVLWKTHNESAVELLLHALDSPLKPIRDGALESLLKRRTTLGNQEIINRLATLDAGAREIVGEYHRYLGRGLRDSIQSADPKVFATGCAATLEFHDYDMLPTLVHTAEDETHPHRDLAAQHVLKLAELLYDELATGQSTSAGRDPPLMRKHMLHSLEQSLARLPQHKRPEIVEALLLLAPREYPALQKILADPMHVAYLSVIDLLTHSTRGGVIRLVLSFLDDPQAPSTVIKLFGRRSDKLFLEHFLRKIGSQPSSVMTQNLHKIETICWMQDHVRLVDQLEEAVQGGSVQLALTSNISRHTKFKLIEHLVRFGKPAGRRAAALALASFQGAEANQLAQEALQDPDPQVQAHVLVQIRSRGITGALPLLLSMLDSQYECIRNAARRSLEEFSFDRFFAAFDSLDDHVRRTTGPTVRKVDLTVPKRLQEELDARSRTRRIRAVAMASSMGLVPQFETQIIQRLTDEDHLVRAEAAKALAQCPTDHARRALLAARHDRSIVVQEGAAQSLQHWGFDSMVEDLLAADAVAAKEKL
ncbi:MAG TPA: HEAT repeat domain-containing protein [Pirellulales bacterium]|jgi:HEAT repeat protein|nr:HEAT repeat domain-containing protein [Pirellulales bacterium]